MPFLMLLAFIGIPLLEIAVFIQVGGLIGLGATLVLVVLTAIAGTLLLRAQGLSTLGRARASLDRGEVPVREVFDGACLLVGGALLLTPGFVTDTLGFLLLLPPFRGFVLERLKRSGHLHVQTMGGFGTAPGGGPGPGRPPQGGPGPVIEGEYEDVGPPRPTRWSGVGPADDAGETRDTDADADRS
ncbi:FxsA family protein [uncultured Rhodospira sp.]|uniref:FxsA family protein n=1 Tax=uncultured Rhodospira sp. TaxID=1936189 RepID=UPI002634E7F6|nr:FxsA family protein [uncultured Rhodospira sp.]